MFLQCLQFECVRILVSPVWVWCVYVLEEIVQKKRTSLRQYWLSYYNRLIRTHVNLFVCVCVCVILHAQKCFVTLCGDENLDSKLDLRFVFNSFSNCLHKNQFVWFILFRTKKKHCINISYLHCKTKGLWESDRQQRATQLNTYLFKAHSLR